MKASKAFSPAGISSFLEIGDKTADGKVISDPERVGARGGGFVIKKGVHTQVKVLEAKGNSVEIFINGKPAPEAATSRAVSESLLAKTKNNYAITILHKVEVPIGAGFGSSAAGALGVALALSEALDLKLTCNQLGRIAHAAEVKCKTGLGTVGPILLGGCIVTVEPGAPGYGIIDRIPITSGYSVVTGTFDSVSTKQGLSSPETRENVNRWGRKTLEAIMEEPSLENFLACCLDFAEKTAFMTP